MLNGSMSKDGLYEQRSKEGGKNNKVEGHNDNNNDVTSDPGVGQNHIFQAWGLCPQG